MRAQLAEDPPRLVLAVLLKILQANAVLGSLFPPHPTAPGATRSRSPRRAASGAGRAAPAGRRSLRARRATRRSWLGQAKLILRLAELVAEVVAEADHVPQLVQLLSQPATARHQRDRRLDPLQPALARRGPPGSAPGSVPPCSMRRGRTRSCFCHSSLGNWYCFSSSWASRSSARALLILGFWAAGLEQLVQPLLERLLRLAQARQPGPGGEEQLAETPLPGADLFARPGQPLVVDAEQRLERVLVDAAEESRQPLVGDDRRIIGTAERVPVAPAADDLQLLAVAVPQLAPDAKLVVGMDEVVGRQVRKAEKQVRQGPQRRRLARLVGAVDQVQALLARGEDPAPRR